jgi:hypothetical protein
VIYIDDVYVYEVVYKDNVDDLPVLLNRQYDSIKLTHEMENYGTLPFLDVILKRGNDDGLHFEVYRRSTNNQRLNASNHSVQQKMAAQLHRSVNISMSREDFVAERNFIFKTAYVNEYDKETI